MRKLLILLLTVLSFSGYAQKVNMVAQGSSTQAIKENKYTYLFGGLSIQTSATPPNKYSLDPNTGDTVRVNVYIDTNGNFNVLNKLNTWVKVLNVDSLARGYYSKTQTDSLLTYIYNKGNHYSDSLVNSFIANAVFGGSIDSASNPHPTVNTYYLATQAALTYDSTGGFRVFPNSFAVISYRATGAIWSISQTPYDLTTYAIRGNTNRTLADVNNDINQVGVHLPDYLYGAPLVSPTLLTSVNVCFTQKGYTVPRNGNIDVVNVNASGTGTLYAIVLRLSAGNYVEVSRTNLAVVDGNQAKPVNIPVLAGDKLGLGMSASIVARYTTGTAKYSAVNIQFVPATFTQANLNDSTTGSNAILGFNFHIAAIDTAGGLREQLAAKPDTTAFKNLSKSLDTVKNTAVFDADVTVGVGKNKFDKATMVLANKLIDNTGALITVSGAKAARIPVTVGQTYSFFQSKYPGTQGGQIRLVNSGLTLVSTFDGNTLPPDQSGRGKKVTIPSNVAFLEMNLYYVTTGYTDITDSLQFEKGTYRTAYAPYGLQVDSVIINGTKLPIPGNSYTPPLASVPYYDKDLVLFGTSITAAAPPRSWVAYMLEKMTFKTVTNLANSGATYSHTNTTVYDTGNVGGSIAPNNVIWNQFNKLKAMIAMGLVDTPEIIIYEGSINDFPNRPVGNVDTTFAVGSSILGRAPNTILTVTDAVRYNIELALQQWPKVQIILMTPYQRGIADNTGVFALGDAIEGCADRLSLARFRQDKRLGIYGYNEINQNIFMYDKLHLNEAGAPKCGYTFAPFLISTLMQ